MLTCKRHIQLVDLLGGVSSIYTRRTGGLEVLEGASSISKDTIFGSFAIAI